MTMTSDANGCIVFSMEQIAAALLAYAEQCGAVDPELKNHGNVSFCLWLNDDGTITTQFGTVN